MSTKAKKGSKAYKAKLSAAQKRSWAKRRESATAKDGQEALALGEKIAAKYRHTSESVPFAVTDEVDHERSVQEVREWISAAPTQEERQQRKAAMFGVMYGAQSKFLGTFSEKVKQQWHEGTSSNRWDSGAGCQQSNIPKEDTEPYLAKPGDWRLDDGGDPSAKPYNPDAIFRSSPIRREDSNPKTLVGDQKVPVLSVVPPASIIAQATAMRYGAYLAPRIDGKRGYGPYNWRDQPIEAHIYIDAAMRHLMQWFDGDEQETVRDDEGRVIDEVSHLAFALATIGILLDAKANSTLIDDRPKVRKMAASNLLTAHKMPRYTK